MTYLVLARKWRPRSFDTLVGQDHVVRALTHALDTQRLHHAWLFTGTRGVGKTTLSRILAKSLNCETGITSKPCGVCRACTEIDAGRFVDYLELDAASNRGVDEMTQLLEQAVYAPGAGRFKVYMIDEVHMLTGHAFNAMLKTLEEPPPHVKFIIATTDPQKIPVTVLSRCLQFNLKQMPPDAIVGHLSHVLGEEQVAAEVPALRLIAQAAAGSMRDALSLTDQAIAYSAGNLTEDAVRGMLGTIDQRHLVRLLDALAAGDALAVLAVADELATRGLSYGGALADLAVLLSRVAIEQRVRGATPADDPLAADVARLAGALHADAVQLFYSVAVHSRQELALAPDEYAGFVMACLRMLSLSGEAGPPQTLPPSGRGSQDAAGAVGAAGAASAPAVPAAAPAVAAAQALAPGGVVPASQAGSAGPAGAVPASRTGSTAAAASAPAAPPLADVSAAPVAQAAAGTVSSTVRGGAETVAAHPGVAGVNATADAAASAASAGMAAPAAVQAAPGAGTSSAASGTSAGAGGQAAVAPEPSAPSAPGATGVVEAGMPAAGGAPPWDQADAATSTRAATRGGAQDRSAAGVASATPTAEAGQTASTAPAASPAQQASTARQASTGQQVPTARPAPAAQQAQQVQPAQQAQQASAVPAADEPPSWVDEVIPDDAEGYAGGDGYFGNDDGYTATADEDEFETLGSAGGMPAATEAPRRGPVANRGSTPRTARGPRLSDMDAASWPALAAQLPVTGLAAEVARQSEWAGLHGDLVRLRLAVRTLVDSASKQRLQTVLCEHFGQAVRLEVEFGVTGDGTAHAVAQHERAARQQAAEEAAVADPFVQALVDNFGGKIVPGSIRAIEPPLAAAA
ncbi:DNA polymerase III subunit gamma/tau [Achromobacter aloeverae]|uniref:DNA-directed DNA polymerase n=1 Tax=Achromobacter aloeverae TaxID=1750518 RepID=A0A4Q1HG39_9BURK|nr:DNA polymerase III subunit gamma/tau [Achromobacter aloeverae]RXN86059.1 DNA polymerase III, subunit gamma and tau [Achromobacter aloeverae]